MVSDKTKKVLITGGSGFIGSKVKKELFSLGYDVVTIGRNKNEDHIIDLLDNSIKDLILEISPNIVCHLASGTNISRAEENKDKEYKDVVSASQSLISALSNLRIKPEKIIYLSSQAIYGEVETLPVSENYKLSPTTIYGKYKLEAEKLIANSSLNYLIFRVSSVYGPTQDYKKSGVIAKFINKLLNNESPIVFNSLDNFSDFIYIDDVVSAVTNGIKKSSHYKNEILNLGAGKPISLKEVIDILYALFPGAPNPGIEKNDIYSGKNSNGLYLDIERINKVLNWKPSYDIKHGLQEMVRELKQNKQTCFNVS